MLPTVLEAAKDRVPNIRFNVAKVLGTLATVVESSVIELQIRPCLNELSEDTDVDVRYFAGQSLTVCMEQCAK